MQTQYITSCHLCNNLMEKKITLKKGKLLSIFWVRPIFTEDEKQCGKRENFVYEFKKH